MTSKQDFTDEEWTRIRRAPLVAPPPLPPPSASRLCIVLTPPARHPSPPPGVRDLASPTPAAPIELAKETMASPAVGRSPPRRPPAQARRLLASVALDVRGAGPAKSRSGRRCWARAVTAGAGRTRWGTSNAARRAQQVLEELARRQRAGDGHQATPQEVEAFGRWLVAAAQAAADAAKEGGFMGFGAEQVSAGEQRMLDQVRAALSLA